MIVTFEPARGIIKAKSEIDILLFITIFKGGKINQLLF